MCIKTTGPRKSWSRSTYKQLWCGSFVVWPRSNLDPTQVQQALHIVGANQPPQPAALCTIDIIIYICINVIKVRAPWGLLFPLESTEGSTSSHHDVKQHSLPETAFKGASAIFAWYVAQVIAAIMRRYKFCWSIMWHILALMLRHITLRSYPDLNRSGNTPYHHIQTTPECVWKSTKTFFFNQVSVRWIPPLLAGHLSMMAAFTTAPHSGSLQLN